MAERSDRCVFLAVINCVVVNGEKWRKVEKSAVVIHCLKSGLR
jgi:hypothetical protein